MKHSTANISPHIGADLSNSDTLAFHLFSVVVDQGIDRPPDVGGDFFDLRSAVEWAAARADLIYVRWIDGSVTRLTASPDPWAEWNGRSRLINESDQIQPLNPSLKEIEAKELKEMRSRAGLTVSELAVLAGVPAQIIDGIESCHRPYVGDLEVWVKLALALSIRATGRPMQSVGWVAVEGTMLRTAIEICGCEFNL